jgi:putative holliday junction resolvase
MGRIIAIDFGLKRTGLAITDGANIIASPLETVDSTDLMKRLKELVSQFDVETIVLGEPKNLDNSPTHVTANVHLLKEALQNEFKEIFIVLHDERFTSKMALDSMIKGGATKKQRREKGNLDKVSAAIILQSYMDSIS